MIQVTKPFLPPRDEYEDYLRGIWTRNWLTNNGPLVNELELRLKEYLGVKYLLLLANGTVALQLAIKALGLKGEIITTGFSYVATVSSIVWEGCRPVFVDVDPKTLNIDPKRIEDAITPETTAIIATHVYGNPCDVEKIEKVAKRHSLKVIYDAAHAFGTKYKGRSIFDYGDVVTTSFHATKVFHTIEGGAVATRDPNLLKKMAFMRNFGHDGPYKFSEVGVNFKNSEFHAAMGLANLKYIDHILRKRKELSMRYDHWLKNFRARKPKVSKDTDYNYAYYPLQVETEELLEAVVVELNRKEIYPRRYFYPALNELAYVEAGSLPTTTEASRRALCLPLSTDLSNEEVDLICRLMLRVQNYGVS